MKSIAARLVAVLLTFSAAAPAIGQGVPDENGAASRPAETPICTDRPTKANVVCTVPQGAFQIETDASNWTRNTDAGVRTDTILYTNPTLKYGLSKSTDLELNVAPYGTVEAHTGGASARLGGVGDLYVRIKQQLTGGTGTLQVSLIPYVKAPTAKLGIGNGQWEGGLITPLVLTLPQGWTLNFGPELDVLANADLRGGHHAQVASLANLSKSVGKATFYAEFWNAQNIDPVGTVHQYSADVAATYLLRPTLQLDLGANFGLNRFTPDTQVYLGLSTRF